MSRAGAIPQVWDGSIVTADSMPWAAGMILGRLSNQFDRIANRSTLLNADSSHFRAVSGSQSTLGVFIDREPM